MKKTRLFALALAGMMTLGSATPVFADTTDVGITKSAPAPNYTLTVPTGNTTIKTNGDFTSIGELKVTSTDTNFDTASKIEVTVTRSTVMTNTDNTITSNNTITYDLYKGENKETGTKVASGDKIDFSASDIDAKTPVKMGVAISGTNYASLVYGDYRDTITFTAEEAAIVVTYERTDGTGTLSSADLGTPTEWIYDNKTYQVYNEFIPSSSGSSWNDAMGFVAALNTAQFDGHGDWTLLSSGSMVSAYAASGTGAMPDSSARGDVHFLWSSLEIKNHEFLAYCLDCDYGDGDPLRKKNADSVYGFVVLRGSSN